MHWDYPTRRSTNRSTLKAKRPIILLQCVTSVGVQLLRGPLPGIARIRSLGSPFSLLLSGLSAFPSRLRLPGGWCGPAPSITSQTILTVHGAEDGRLGPALACTDRTSWLRRSPHSLVSGGSPRLPSRACRESNDRLRTRGQAADASGSSGAPSSRSPQRRADRCSCRSAHGRPREPYLPSELTSAQLTSIASGPGLTHHATGDQSPPNQRP